MYRTLILTAATLVFVNASGIVTGPALLVAAAGLLLVAFGWRGDAARAEAAPARPANRPAARAGSARPIPA